MQQSSTANISARPKAFAALSQIETWFCYATIAILSLQILVLAQHTFLWRYGEDVGFFYYFSWLANEHDYLPYRDLHDTSFPNTFLIYSLITKVAGYSVRAYHITHMILFSILCFVSYTLLKRVNARMAIAATCMFGCNYFSMDRSMHMQREFLILILLISALAVMTSHWSLHKRSFLTGLLFAFLSLIKPNAAIAAPLVIILFANNSENKFNVRHAWNAIWISMLAFMLAWIIAITYMIKTGIWVNFSNMVTQYLPLYQGMNGNHIRLSTSARLLNCLDSAATAAMFGMLSTLLLTREHLLKKILISFFIAITYLVIGLIYNPGGSYFFIITLLPGIAGLIFYCQVQNASNTKKRLVVLILMLWPTYNLYVDIAGKHWEYHRIPEIYFSCAILALVFIPFKAKTWLTFFFRVFYLLLSAAFINMYIWPTYAIEAACLAGNPICDTEEQQAYSYEDSLEIFLRKNVKENERVEPLATSTLGPLFPALLRAGIQPSTPYLEGFPLYHDADSAYVQNIRNDMLAHLAKNPPRFMIRPTNFYAPGGASASRFVELENYVNDHYERVTSRQYPELDDKIPVTIYEIKKH